MTSKSDHNLLFGIIALQMDFVRRDQLVAATSTWLTDKSRQIDQILIEQGALSEADHSLLAPLVERHLENHGGDPQQSLAVLSSIGSVATELRSLGDEQIDATLPPISSEQPDGLADAREEDTVQHQVSGPRPSAEDAHSRASTRFRILRPHAKGGLGEVSVAQDTELNREVALKEIQSRFADDEASRSRFLLEAEVTGGLEHPGIVPVYGLGRYADGRPFYAMRFIKGDSLREAADRFHLMRGEGNKTATDPSPGYVPHQQAGFDGIEFRKLLGRFVDVCQAIEYAHSRGVLHRDLKPGNIMIGKYGETLVVDWGLAKAAGRKETSGYGDEHTLRPASTSGSVPTVMGSAIGTPAFMPPEQAAGRLDDLGPTSDVYSLGATLYYMLAGEAPFGGRDITEILEAVQAGRFPALHTVQPDVPKSLEAICAKAMALRPADRYTSPQQLADDVERFLADEPVSARVDPLLLRARRWMRKHPKIVTSIAATLLVGLSSATVISVVVAGKNRELALKNQEVNDKNTQLVVANDNERQAKEKAETRLAQIKKANEALGTIFRDLDPEQVNESDLLLRDALVANLESVIEQLAGDTVSDPLMVVEAQQTLGESLIGLTEYDKAIEVLETARATRTDKLGLSHPDTLQSMNNLGIAYHESGQLEKAVRIHQQTLELREKELGAEHPQTLVSMNNLGNTLLSAGEVEEAIQLHEQALQLQKRNLGFDHDDTLITMSNLALDYFEAGQTDKALQLWQQEYELTKAKQGDDHPSTLTSMNSLANGYQRAGQLDKALPLAEQVVELNRARRGLDHARTLTSMNTLASIYQDLGQLDKAVTIFEQTLELESATLGPDHPSTLTTMSNLANAYLDAGELTKALALHEKSLELREATLGLDHPRTMVSRNSLAAAYYLAGQIDKAMPLQQQTLERSRAKLGPDHPDTFYAMNNLANSYSAAGQLDKSLALLKQTVEWAEAHLGADHPSTLLVTSNLATSHVEAGQLEIARELYARAAEMMKEKIGPDHFLTFDTFGKLGRTYVDLGRVDEGLPLLERAYREREDPRMKFRHGTHLFRAYHKSGNSEQAATLTKELSESMRAQLAKVSTRLQFADQMAKFSRYLLEANAFDDAAPLLRESLAVKVAQLPDKWSTFDTQSMLGEALRKQQKYAESETLLLAGHQGLLDHEEEIPSHLKSRLTESLQRLVNLYKSWHAAETDKGYDTKAREWQQKLDEQNAQPPT